MEGVANGGIRKLSSLLKTTLKHMGITNKITQRKRRIYDNQLHNEKGNKETRK